MQRAAEFAVQPVECCIHLNLITDQSTSVQTATAQHSAACTLEPSLLLRDTADLVLFYYYTYLAAFSK